MTLQVVISREGELWVSHCPQIDVASQGGTVEQARRNLEEAVTLWLESADEAELRRQLGRESYLSSIEVGVA
jgi:predicted RNase H-like HicB family nuclease